MKPTHPKSLRLQARVRSISLGDWVQPAGEVRRNTPHMVLEVANGPETCILERVPLLAGVRKGSRVVIAIEGKA